jgi:hypothetical protein
MAYRVARATRDRRIRRRGGTISDGGQYSLFAAESVSGAADARHFLRQAQLCERLLSGLHQPELVELLGRLHEEFEAKAGVADHAT